MDVLRWVSLSALQVRKQFGSFVQMRMREPFSFGGCSIISGFFPFLLLLFFSLFFLNSHALGKQGKDKCYSSCGPLLNITFPFRLKDDPQGCGITGTPFELTCENNTTQPVIHLPPRRYYVQEISYEQKKIRISDPGLESSLIPLYSGSPSLLNTDLSSWGLPYESDVLVFLNCSQPVNEPSYVATAPCNLSSPHAHVYAMIGNSISVSQLHTSCRVVMNLPTLDAIRNLNNCSAIHDVLIRGFYIDWMIDTCNHGNPDCWNTGLCDAVDVLSRTRCSSCKRFFQSFSCFFQVLSNYLEVIAFYFFYKKDLAIIVPAFYSGYIEVYLLGRTAIGILCLLVFLLYKFRRRHIWMDTTVEVFLSNYKFQMPRRYSYSDIKKMTKNFREQLGQGGFGAVFKGKLSDGRLVAIKKLKELKGNGQDFINEVATIGRTHHVNVVRLIGFCSEGSKRALVYEFMANGSLEKYIFTRGKNSSLCWNKMYQIALGIARGIEYLHRGCDIRILHFDIKPHNILLDENFIPKVSDFGLAKFYPIEDSLVSITAGRGTIGYIAPELLYKAFGGVSHKSDVYSFGMMLLEMTGRKKNIDAFAEHSSQLDFPVWVYDQLNNGEDMVMENIADNDKEIAKKMMIVALWCIQLKPAERPSMSKVIEMLEGSINDLHMPAKPLLSSPHMFDRDQYLSMEPVDSSTPHMLDRDQYLSMEPVESSTTHQLGSISQEVIESNISIVLED